MKREVLGSISYKDSMQRGVYGVFIHAAMGVYVGRASNFGLRWIGHESGLRNGTHQSPIMQDEFYRHGMRAVSYEILRHAESFEQAVCMEYQSKGYTLYNSDFPSNRTGRNIQSFDDRHIIFQQPRWERKGGNWAKITSEAYRVDIVAPCLGMSTNVFLAFAQLHDLEIIRADSATGDAEVHVPGVRLESVFSAIRIHNKRFGVGLIVGARIRHDECPLYSWSSKART